MEREEMKQPVRRPFMKFLNKEQIVLESGKVIWKFWQSEIEHSFIVKRGISAVLE